MGTSYFIKRPCELCHQDISINEMVITLDTRCTKQADQYHNPNWNRALKAGSIGPEKIKGPLLIHAKCYNEYVPEAIEVKHKSLQPNVKKITAKTVKPRKGRFELIEE